MKCSRLFVIFLVTRQPCQPEANPDLPLPLIPLTAFSSAMFPKGGVGAATLKAAMPPSAGTRDLLSWEG